MYMENINIYFMYSFLFYHNGRWGTASNQFNWPTVAKSKGKKLKKNQSKTILLFCVLPLIADDDDDESHRSNRFRLRSDSQVGHVT